MKKFDQNLHFLIKLLHEHMHHMLPRVECRCWFWNRVVGRKYCSGDLVLTASILLNFWREKVPEDHPLVDQAEKELNLHFVFEVVYSSKQLMKGEKKKTNNQTTEPRNTFPFLLPSSNELPYKRIFIHLFFQYCYLKH